MADFVISLQDSVDTSKVVELQIGNYIQGAPGPQGDRGPTGDVTQDALDAKNAAQAAATNSANSAASASASALSAADAANAAATAVGNSLRADLSSFDPAKGAALVGYAAGTVKGALDQIANGTATDAGALTGSEYATVSRGTGVLKTTLTAIAQWVLQTFQGFTQSGAGAAPQSIVSKLLRQAIDVTDYGADPTGVADSSASVNAAWTAAVSAGVNLRWPDGTYLLNGTVTGKPIVHIGGRVKVIFNNFSGKNGFTFQPATVVGSRGGLIGFELVAMGQNGLTAVEMPKQADQYSTYQTKWVFRDLYCHGANRNLAAYSFAWDFGFAKWFRLSDCTGLEFANVTVQGTFDIQNDPSVQFQDAAIEMDAASSLLTARIDKLNVGPIHTAIRWGDRAFFSISHSDIIGTFRGIYQTGTTIYNEPKIHNCNINAQDTGVYFNGTGSIDIDSVTIRRHSSGWKGGSAVWDG